MLSAIFALMATLLTILSDIAKMTQSYLTLINPPDPGLAISYFYAVILITSFITAVNIYLADGDSVFTFTYYFGLLLLVSGASFWSMAVGSSQILSSFAGISGRMSTLVPQG